jgi:glycosyltransferase involved in cell wall biosynthesis
MAGLQTRQVDGRAGSRRVSIVLDFLNSGGAERAALNLAVAAPRTQCQVVAEWDGGDLRADPLASSVTVLSASTERLGRARRVANLARHLRRERPDFLVSMLSPLVATLAGELARVPVVHWLQAPWTRSTAAGGRDAHGRAATATLRFVGRRSAMVMAATPGLVEECVGLGIPREKLVVLPNGLELPPVAPPRTPAPGAPRKLVTVGRLERPKRHDLLLRAVAALQARGHQLELTLVGSGSEEADLRRLAESLGLAGSARFAGFVADPAAALREADVFILATEYEGFGNVIVEAMAGGLPVVVSDVPYGPRFITQGDEYATLVEPGSAEALADGIEAALARLPLPADVRRRAQERAAEFSVERVADQFEELLDQIRPR